MKKFALVTAAFILLANCTTPVEKLSPDASKVTVLDKPSIADLEKLDRVGHASCEIGGNAHTHDTNKESCENYLRNEAASKGADYLVFSNSAETGMTTAYIEATFYKKK